MKDLDLQQIVARLSAIPHLNFGHYPTPIEELPRLRQALGKSPRIFAKRDDYAGPGFGGNKVRKLQYVLAQAVADQVEVVITAGSLKSNHARVTAALCAKLGLRCILVLNSPAVMFESLSPASLSLDEMFGAEIRRVSSSEERAPTMLTIAEQLRNEGRRALVIPLGASIPLGAIGFVLAVQEAQQQFAALGEQIDYVFHSSSSGGTQAGLIAGNQLFKLVNKQIIGVSSGDPAPSMTPEIAAIIRGVGEMLGLPSGFFDESVMVLDEYIGGGYGVPSKEGDAAIDLLARSEGLVLDPVYTGKAMAGLIDWIRKGRLSENENVLFWHTGGQLAIFYTPQERPRA